MIMTLNNNINKFIRQETNRYCIYLAGESKVGRHANMTNQTNSFPNLNPNSSHLYLFCFAARTIELIRN